MFWVEIALMMISVHIDVTLSSTLEEPFSIAFFIRTLFSKEDSLETEEKKLIYIHTSNSLRHIIKHILGTIASTLSTRLTTKTTKIPNSLKTTSLD